MQISILGKSGGVDGRPLPPPLEPPPPPPVFDYIAATDPSLSNFHASSSGYWPPVPPFYSHYQGTANAFQPALPPVAMYGENQRAMQLYMPGMVADVSGAYAQPFGVIGNVPQEYSTFTHLIDPPPPPPVLSSFDEENCNDKGESGSGSHNSEERSSEGSEGEESSNADCSDAEPHREHPSAYNVINSKNRNKESEGSFERGRAQLLDEQENDGTASEEVRSKRVLSAEELELTCRSQFTGRPCVIPDGSGRPQSSEGRTFPSKQRFLTGPPVPLRELFHDKEDYERNPFSAISTVLPHLKKRVVQEDALPSSLLIRTATKLVRKAPTSSSASIPHSESLTVTVSPSVPSSRVAVVTGSAKGVEEEASPRLSLPTSRSSSALAIGRSSPAMLNSKRPAGLSNDPTTTPRGLKKIMSSGTLSRNGMTWRRRPANDALKVTSETRILKVNRKLRRINDQVFGSDSNECFEFAQYGKCRAGIFCIYEHKGDTEHQKMKVCLRLLRGQCRKTNCKFGHRLEAHQMPICDFYMRVMCTDEECRFMHVKHSPFLKPCEAFNRGICYRGVECEFPHRYVPAVLHKRGDAPSLRDRHAEQMPSEVGDEKADVGLKEECPSLKWII